MTDEEVERWAERARVAVGLGVEVEEMEAGVVLELLEEVKRLRVLEGAVREVMAEEGAWVAPKGPRGSGQVVGRPVRGPKAGG